MKSAFSALAVSATLLAGNGPALASPPAPLKPMAARALTPERQAAAIVDAMTLDEQISLLRTSLGVSVGAMAGALPPGLPAEALKAQPGALGSAGFIPGIPRLGLPALQESDAGLGVANMGGLMRPGDEATALPSSLALAASFDPALARRSGEMIGAEAHAKGFNVQLAGGVDLTREPRNGRNFEYAGEDPLLAGQIVGAAIAGIQSRHVVSTIKHYAMNDQETGREVLDAQIGDAALRESDLLAFQIAIEAGHPGSVMCAYNRVNGAYACENDFLLSTVLKGDWRYPGWVMSDWGAVHSLLPAIKAGLDQQSPQIGKTDWFAGLSAAVAKGDVSRAKVRDMAFRIVRALATVGVLDDPARPGGAIDVEAHAAVAQASAEAGMVLLKNEGVLPLARGVRRVLLVGGNADRGVPTGGGSSQVAPFGGLQLEGNPRGLAVLTAAGYIPSSPMKALKAERPDLSLAYDDGSDPDRAAAAARGDDLVIVFAGKPQGEAFDAADLSLPGRQDDLIGKIAAANAHTVVVLETGNPVAMPWLDKVRGVLEAWYPGQRGGDAIAAILSGARAPSGRLPITFPQSLGQLPRPMLDGAAPGQAPAGLTGAPPPPFAVSYGEGSDVGYRWFEKTGAKPLFPFGYGLTYTHFAYSDLQAEGGASLKVKVRITNTGERSGVEIAQLYVAPPGRTHRLAGWARLELKPHQAKVVTLTADPRLLASYDPSAKAWSRAGGVYHVVVSQAAGLPGLSAKVDITARPGQGE